MRKLLSQLFGRTPREFANPRRRVVESFPELVSLIDQHNGLTTCFVSAYAFATDERSYSDVLINKAIFDFDGSWSHLVRTHEWLEERGAAHFAVFSGSDGSGHLYVLTKPTRHQQSLEYFQRDVVIDGVGLRECHYCGNRVERRDGSGVVPWYCPVCEQNIAEHDTELVVDGNLVGEPATHIRVPNTYHTGADRYCVPLKPEEITNDLGRVYEAAQSQRDLELADIVCGDKPVDIAQKAEAAEQKYRSYDQRRLPGVTDDITAFNSFEAEVDPPDMMEDIDCECVRRLITDDRDRRTQPALGHHERRVLVSYLVERGYNPAEIAEFLWWAIDDEKADHSINEEEQPVRVWRDGVKAPNKRTLKREGYWRRGCPVHGRPEVEA